MLKVTEEMVTKGKAQLEVEEAMLQAGFSRTEEAEKLLKLTKEQIAEYKRGSGLKFGLVPLADKPKDTFVSDEIKRRAGQGAGLESMFLRTEGQRLKKSADKMGQSIFDNWSNILVSNKAILNTYY